MGEKGEMVGLLVPVFSFIQLMDAQMAQMSDTYSRAVFLKLFGLQYPFFLIPESKYPLY